jgi:hypothetical protein
MTTLGKQEPVVEGILSQGALIIDEVPYSIYTRKEKWLIVGMVALAGFYRYANTSP